MSVNMDEEPDHDFSVISDSPNLFKRIHDSSPSPFRENPAGLLGRTTNPCKKVKQTSLNSVNSCEESSDEQNSSDGVTQNPQTVFVFKKIKRLSREGLEQNILQKVVQAITVVGPITNLEEKIHFQEQKIQSMERKIAELHKEVISLTAITRSFVSQANDGKFKAPIKTTRSVGVQVKTSTVNDIIKFEPTTVNYDSTLIHIDDDDDGDEDADDDIIEIPIENNLHPVSSSVSQQSDSFLNQNVSVVPPLPCLPVQTEDDFQGPIPPSPILQVSKVAEKIVLSWTFEKHLRQDKVISYQVWIFKEGQLLNRWEPMKDDIKAISLTMACEIPMAAVKPELRLELRNRYYFAVRAVDLYSRFGHFSNVASTTFP